MKRTNKILSLVMSVVLMCLTAAYINANGIMLENGRVLLDAELQAYQLFISEEEIDELMPHIASGCSDYYYYYRGMDIDAVVAERGWSMQGKYIYENGVEIGRYDDGSNGQDPHFHLYSEPGVHYILA